MTGSSPGIGKRLLKKVVDISKKHGICRFRGMIDPQNKLIRQVLQDLGYKVNCTLKSGVFQVEIIIGRI